MTTPPDPKTGSDAETSGGAIAVDLVEEAGDWSALADAADVIQQAADAVGAKPLLLDGERSVCIVLASDEAVMALNAQFRGKLKPTNVLSFPPGAGAPEDFLGDIVLAQETVAREALEQGTPFPHHVQHLVVHGLLHLLGFDHETSEDAEEMEALEIGILAGLGIANPYTGELDQVT